MFSLAHAVGVSVSPYSVSGIRSLELLIFSDFLWRSFENQGRSFTFFHQILIFLVGVVERKKYITAPVKSL